MSQFNTYDNIYDLPNQEKVRVAFVPKEVVDDIIETAKWAPSSYNTQTWRVHAVTGVGNRKYRKHPSWKAAYKEEYEGIHRQRQIDVAIQQLWALSAMTRRSVWIGCCVDFANLTPLFLWCSPMTSLEPAAKSQFALGSLAYGIVLAAWERGLGCVINGQGIMQSDVVVNMPRFPMTRAS